MKKWSLLFSFVALILASCEKAATDSDLLSADQKEAHPVPVVLNFNAHLTGDQEVPARETLATGQAVFKLSKDGSELYFKVIVANLENLSVSHIHVAPAGQNGPVVVFLYPSAPPPVLLPGTTNGVLNEGIITSANLIGILAGQELSALVDLMVSGSTYVNVHTSLYPGGEIRGQINSNVKIQE